MYINKLSRWGNKEWNRFFKQYPHLKHGEKKEVQQILTMATKHGVESNFDRLYELRIINGIGPFWFSKHFRAFITWLFPYFRYEWHDLLGGIGGTEEDRKESDLGMLKYTTLSIQKKTNERIDIGNTFIIAYNLFVSVPFKYLIAYIFYVLVRIFGRFGSFNYY